ncbi:MAG TPA: discoidin domain-containing protein, partial [Pyrinomonadaceae bacterium]|nr:discoidin domain-containing protein [Pyrinomonadaceae bacterium]
MSSALLVSMLVVAPLSSAKSPHKTKSTTPVVNPQGNSQRQRQPAPRDDSRKVDPIQPERGAPAANLPNLEELRSRKPEKPEAPPPVPSTIRSKRKHQPNGNGVNSNSLVRPADDGAGTSISRNGLSRSENRSLRSHHARRGAPSFTPTESATAAPPFAAMPQSSSNVALNKLATQSSTYGGAGGAVPGLAVDGNTSGNWWPDYSVSSTNADAGAWWQVDLGGTFAIQSVEVWNRTDCCGDRLTNFDVILRDQNLNDISTVNFPGQAGTPSTISISGAARYVKIKLAGTNYLSLAEVRVWGTPIGSASDSERALARLDPFNQPGNQLKARDCEWSLPLVSLPGRAGWDLGLTLYYSSMVWTRAANSMYFDEDNGNPSPGFR